METTTGTCRYCLSPLHGVICPHCDLPHDRDRCTLCELAARKLHRVLRAMKR